MAVPSAKAQVSPGQRRNSTGATPEPVSAAPVAITCPLTIVAPSAGAVTATVGTVASGLTTKLREADRPAPLPAVTVFDPDAVAPALHA